MTLKKPENTLTGDFTPLNEFCKRLTNGQGEDKIWYQLRPCSISSTGAVKMIRAANMIKHPSGSDVFEALEYLTSELGLKGAVAEDTAADSDALDFVTLLRGHQDATPCVFFYPVTAGNKTKQWFEGYTVNKLEPALKLLGVTPKGSKAQKAQQLRDSLGNAISTPGVTDVQLKVLSSWYLKPFKGSKDTRAAIKNESTIFFILPAYLEAANYCDCPRITKLQVTQLRDVGLGESRGNANLTCSTDHLCMLRIVWASGEVDYYEPAVCELKTRTKDETVAAELDVLGQASLYEVYHVASKEDFHKYVREPVNRVQNWHHVSSYGRRFSLYIIARKDAILRFVLLEVPQEQREKYMHYMGVLWKTYMAPFESVVTIPVEMKTADLGFLATYENLQFSIAYRIGLRKLVEQEGVLPPARHILDIPVALWNNTKGGTDQYSRAMEDLHGKWENFLSPTSRLTVRTLKTVFFQAKNAYCL